LEQVYENIKVAVGKAVFTWGCSQCFVLWDCPIKQGTEGLFLFNSHYYRWTWVNWFSWFPSDPPPPSTCALKRIFTDW